jgi:hypothetical protein
MMYCSGLIQTVQPTTELAILFAGAIRPEMYETLPLRNIISQPLFQPLSKPYVPILKPPSEHMFIVRDNNCDRPFEMDVVPCPSSRELASI